MSDAITTTARRWTVADLESLPDDGNRYEIIDGELHVTSAPHVWHQVVVGKVATALDVWSTQTAAGLTIPGPGVIESPTDAVIPDVVWVSRDRFPGLLGDDGKLHGAPDLVVEVISPNDLYTEVEDKVAEWLEHGARLIFVVNPRRRTVAVHRPDRPLRVLSIGDTLDGEDVVPGWSLPVRAIFA